MYIYVDLLVGQWIHPSSLEIDITWVIPQMKFLCLSPPNCGWNMQADKPQEMLHDPID